jgi:hypothetical protein
MTSRGMVVLSARHWVQKLVGAHGETILTATVLLVVDGAPST